MGFINDSKSAPTSASGATFDNMTDLRLGPLVREFRAGRRRGTVFFGVILLFIGLTIIGLSVYSDAFREGLPLTAGLFLGAIISLIGVFLIENTLRTQNQRALLFNDGLVFEKKGIIQMMLWTEIVNVWQAITKHYYNGIHTGTTVKLTLEKSDRTQLILTERLQKAEELCAAVQNKVVPLLYSQVVERLKSGQSIGFGNWIIGLGGISNGKQSYQWDELEPPKIHRGYVTLKKRGVRFGGGIGSISIGTIPNAYVIIELITRLIPNQTN